MARPKQTSTEPAPQETPQEPQETTAQEPGPKPHPDAVLTPNGNWEIRF